ncbi:MAG: hypothetical protein KDE22_08770 [Rhodobacterales bacterium]|nr:hypothetical protein [Rhodobacterales bacterium]
MISKERYKNMIRDLDVEAFRDAAERFTKKTTASKKAARAQLVKEGIITKSGKLTPRYGG